MVKIDALLTGGVDAQQTVLYLYEGLCGVLREAESGAGNDCWASEGRYTLSA